MGMYTELHFDSALIIGIPENIVKVLNYMIYREDTDFLKPDHPLFSNYTRWSYMLICDSYYFDADTHTTLRLDYISNRYYLCVKTNLKNYNDEINLFINWITHYLDKFEGEFLGFKRYDEDEMPTLIFHKEIYFTPEIEDINRLNGR